MYKPYLEITVQNNLIQLKTSKILKKTMNFFDCIKKFTYKNEIK